MAILTSIRMLLPKMFWDTVLRKSRLGAELTQRCQTAEDRCRDLVAQRDELGRERDRLTSDRDALEAERDQLKLHCRRLESHAAEGHKREERMKAANDSLLQTRDLLEKERNELAEHCRRLNEELALATRYIPVNGECVVDRMRTEWNDRARANARYYTNTAQSEWNESEYLASGESNVREYILTDLENICQGSECKTMRVLEIGCGAGRMTRPLAGVFGEVHAVDISAEMIRLARQRLAGVSNAFFYETNGRDLSVLTVEGGLDFAFSFIVFQHIPDKDIIESYIKEVHRLLKPGRLFKFQVQGASVDPAGRQDTWLGAGFTVAEMQAIADRCGFEMKAWCGENSQYFWVWFFKK